LALEAGCHAKNKVCLDGARGAWSQQVWECQSTKWCLTKKEHKLKWNLNMGNRDNMWCTLFTHGTCEWGRNVTKYRMRCDITASQFYKTKRWTRFALYFL
jgi:hypothetical protein